MNYPLNYHGQSNYPLNTNTRHFTPSTIETRQIFPLPQSGVVFVLGDNLVGNFFIKKNQWGPPVIVSLPSNSFPLHLSVSLSRRRPRRSPAHQQRPRMSRAPAAPSLRSGGRPVKLTGRASSSRARGSGSWRWTGVRMMESGGPNRTCTGRRRCVRGSGGRRQTCARRWRAVAGVELVREDGDGRVSGGRDARLAREDGLIFFHLERASCRLASTRRAEQLLG